jgi:hypothetical protein
MVNHTTHNISIIYKYDKYYQVSGSLFYGFEYFLKTLETFRNSVSNKNKKIYDINFIIILPPIIKRNTETFNRYKDNIFRLFELKYDLQKVGELCSGIGSCGGLTGIFKRIKFLTPLSYHRYIHKLSTQKEPKETTEITETTKATKTINNLIYISYNTWLGSEFIFKIPFLEVNIFIMQNRKVSQLNDRSLVQMFNNIPESVKLILLYELLPQRIPSNIIKTIDPTGKNIIQKEYNLKLGLDYFNPKESFKNKPTEKLYSGLVPDSSLTGTFMKPNKFININFRDNILNTKKLIYGQNFINFDENSRIIIEARYYGINIEVIPNHTYDHEGLKVNPVNPDNPKYEQLNELLEDSSVLRLIKPIEDYTLTKDDYLFKEIREIK